jgi:hypothetical protein
VNKLLPAFIAAFFGGGAFCIVIGDLFLCEKVIYLIGAIINLICLLLIRLPFLLLPHLMVTMCLFRKNFEYEGTHSIIHML